MKSTAPADPASARLLQAYARQYGLASPATVSSARAMIRWRFTVRSSR